MASWVFYDFDTRFWFVPHPLLVTCYFYPHSHRWHFAIAPRFALHSVCQHWPTTFPPANRTVQVLSICTKPSLARRTEPKCGSHGRGWLGRLTGWWLCMGSEHSEKMRLECNVERCQVDRCARDTMHPKKSHVEAHRVLNNHRFGDLEAFSVAFNSLGTRAQRG